MAVKERVRPSIEYNRLPVLGGCLVMVGGGVVVNFLLGQPGWLFAVSFLSGGVAGGLSGFYDPAANNGAIAVLLGMVLLMPVLAYTRTAWAFGIQDTGDIAFFSIVLVGAWSVAVLTLAIVGYTGAIVADAVRRRIDLL